MTGPINTYGYLFDLGAELNIPTWYAVVQLFTVALVLGVVAMTRRVQGAPVAAWWGLAGIFIYLSLDEATDMHGLWRRWLGDYKIPGMEEAAFSWIIPGLIGGLLADHTFLNDSYLVAVTFEESCELYGILIMLYAVLQYLGGQSITLSVGGTARGSSSGIRHRAVG